MAEPKTPILPAKTGLPAISLQILAGILGLIILAWSVQRCVANIVHTESLATAASPDADPRLGADWRLYSNAVRQFHATGELYPRPTLEQETVASMYAPMTPISRFTPAFHLQLLPFAKSTDPEALIKPTRIAMMVAYGLACLALIGHIMMLMHQRNISPSRIALFCIFSSIAATSTYGLQDAIILTNYEIPIFSLLVVAFFCFRKYPGLSAILIGYLASAKYYPLFMASMLVTRFDRTVISLFILSLVFFFGMGWLAFGYTENYFYFSQALPVLLSEKVAPILYNMSFGGAIFKFTQNAELSQIAFQIYRLAFLGMCFYFLAKHSNKVTATTPGFFAMLMTTMLICLPNYWQAYLIMLFPAFCIATYRVIMLPCTASASLLLIAMASMATDNNSWLTYGAPAWIGGGPPDHIGNQIINAARNQNETLAILMFAQHYPKTALLYLLEQSKFIVPAVLWFFTAREIISPALPRSSAD